MQERLEGREIPIRLGIARLEMQNEACGGETTRNALLKSSRERAMD